MTSKRVDISSVASYIDQHKKEEMRLEFFEQFVPLNHAKGL